MELNMSRKQRVNSEVGSWPQVISFTEEKLQISRRKTAELEAMLALFRELEATNQPSPADLSGAAKGQKHQKQA